MRGVDVDPEQRTARVAGGALLAELDDRRSPFGLVCPVGVVSHTGVAGLTLGGGMGRLQRKHGLTIDNLLEVELVTADGRLVRASEDENPGSSGAARRRRELRDILHVPPDPLDGVITHGTVVHPVERRRSLQPCSATRSRPGPTSSGPASASARRRRPVATVSVHHCGPPSRPSGPRGAASVRAAARRLDRCEAVPEAQHLHDEEEAWGHRFYMKSAFLHSLPDELVDLAVEHVSRVPRARTAALDLGLGRCDRERARRRHRVHGTRSELLAGGRDPVGRSRAGRRVPRVGPCGMAGVSPFASPGAT